MIIPWSRDAEPPPVPSVGTEAVNGHAGTAQGSRGGLLKPEAAAPEQIGTVPGDLLPVTPGLDLLGLERKRMLLEGRELLGGHRPQPSAGPGARAGRGIRARYSAWIKSMSTARAMAGPGSTILNLHENGWQ